jgi:hypothetical protein
VALQQERRLSRRKTLERVTYIDLPSHNGGIVIDVSEGGLCFHAIARVENGGPVHFTFSSGSEPIAGMGELMWTDENGKTGGLRFTELSEEVREQIRSWPLDCNLRFQAAKAAPTDALVASGSPATASAPKTTTQETPRAIPPTTPAAPALLAKSAMQASTNSVPSSYAPYFPAAASIETQRGKRSKRKSRFIKAIGIASLAGFVGVASYLCFREARGWMAALRSNRGPGQGAGPSPGTVPLESVAASSAPVTPLAQDSRASSTQTATTATPQTPAAASGTIFVQVAAYTREADALNLVYMLRGQDFIASVSPPTSDAYYRVQLGPYTTMEAAQIGKRELEKAGFEAFIRR